MKKLVIKKEDLLYNLNIIRNKIGNEIKLIAVVKANGMGLDLIQYSRFLIENGVEMLAVATIEEALVLRQAGIEKDILLLSEVILEDEIEALIKNDVILTIGSLEEKNVIEKIANKLNKVARAHVKIDTGFARYGFLYTDKEEILETLKNTQNLKLVGMFTHFSKAIDEKWTRLQFKRFKQCIELVDESLFENNEFIFHCANTTAALKYPEMKLNAVRVGSGIQGRVLNEFSYLNLKKVGVLETQVIKIKNVPKGYNISYSNEFKTKKETKVAIIPVGYMDGLNIKNQRDSFNLKNNVLSVLMEIKKIFRDNSFKVKIKNDKFTVIGRYGMFHTIIDITGAEININEDVILEVAPIYINSNIRREYI